MRRGQWTRLAVAASLVALVLGCAATRQTRGEVKPSGFLTPAERALLRPGEGEEAKLRYVDAKADFSRYQAVLVESVTLWSGPELAKLSADEKRALVDHAYEALVTALGKSFRIVKESGAGTLRVRAAITEATGSAVAPDLVATVIPQVRLIGTLAGLAADSAVTVGEATGEVAVTDSVTKQLLAAGVDQRVGQRSLRGVFSKWDDVEEAWNHWAEQLRARLVAAGAGHAPVEAK